MASPDAAQSRWVQREITWWLENKSPQRILVVLTAGELSWDDVDSKSALPAALHGVFAEEPRWVDLRWLHDSAQVDQSNPRFREAVADVAAAVHGVPKDELIGEHIRQHRRTLRLVRAGVAALVVLLTVALVAAGIAVVQLDRAVAAHHTAIARGMEAEADRVRRQDPRLALQLGIAADRLDGDAPAQPGLQQTLESSSPFTTLRGHTNLVRSLSYAPDGHTLATASIDQAIRLWDLQSPDGLRQIGRPLTDHDDYVNGVTLHPTGTLWPPPEETTRSGYGI
jgi:hypothetical protein